jgi:hypothetical protein
LLRSSRPVPLAQDRMGAVKAMAVVELAEPGASTAAGSTAGLVDFMAARSMAGMVDFTEDLLEFPMAGFTAVGFTLTDFTASGFITMASAAA